MAKEHTLRISFVWAARRKQWDIIAVGGDGRKAWTMTLAADTTAELDQSAGWLVLRAIQAEMETWLTFGPEYA